MNWVMRSNNKISLCFGHSEMAIIQQCSHFRQRTFSYIMHPNHCIFPPFWATMHISSSEWNIKHSYDLIFSSKGDLSLYFFFASLAPPLGPNVRGMSFMRTSRHRGRCLIGYRQSNDQWGNQSVQEFIKAQGSLIHKRPLSGRLGWFQLIWLKLEVLRPHGFPSSLRPQISNANCYSGGEIDEEIGGEGKGGECAWSSQKLRRRGFLLTS